MTYVCFLCGVWAAGQLPSLCVADSYNKSVQVVVNQVVMSYYTTRWCYFCCSHCGVNLIYGSKNSVHVFKFMNLCHLGASFLIVIVNSDNHQFPMNCPLFAFITRGLVIWVVVKLLIEPTFVYTSVTIVPSLFF